MRTWGCSPTPPGRERGVPGTGLVPGLAELLGSVLRSWQRSRTEKPNGFANPLALI